MKALLIHQGLADALVDQETDEKPDAKRLEVLQKAHNALILSLDDKVLREVARETTASGIWKKLEELYMAKSLANRLYLKQQLYAYRFLDDKGLGEQLDQFNKFVDDLENIGVKLEDEDKAIVLLNALPSSYEQLKDALLYGRDKPITLLEVQTALKAKEFQKSSLSHHDAAAEVLNVKKFKNKFKPKAASSKNHHDKEKGEKKETRSCHYCKKPGHIKKNCFSWKRKQAAEGNDQGSTDVVQEELPMQILNVVEGEIGESWIVDSGCSFHICSHKEWFEKFEPSQGSVLLGNDQVCSIRGVGDIKLKLKDGSVIMLTKVRFISEIKRNLVSLGVLETRGYNFRSENGHMKIYNGSRAVMSAARKRSLYYLEADVVAGLTNSAQKVESDFRKWHVRLGHLGAKAILQLIKKCLIEADQGDSAESCEQCLMGKSSKQPFPKGKHTSKAVLEYAHSDIWGQLNHLQ